MNKDFVFKPSGREQDSRVGKKMPQSRGGRTLFKCKSQNHKASCMFSCAACLL